MEQRTLAKPPRRERVEAWVLTGPPGRAWSFAGDMAAAMPMIARYWAQRARERRKS